MGPARFAVAHRCSSSGFSASFPSQIVIIGHLLPELSCPCPMIHVAERALIVVFNGEFFLMVDVVVEMELCRESQRLAGHPVECPTGEASIPRLCPKPAEYLPSHRKSVHCEYGG